MMREKPKKNGFSFLELAFSLTIFTVVMLMLVIIIMKFTDDQKSTHEMTQIHYILKQKVERIRALDFWPWSFDTDIPTFSVALRDPAREWKAEMSEFADLSGTMNVTFQKLTDYQYDLYDFDPPEFDNDLFPRNMVNIEIGASGLGDAVATQAIGVVSLPTHDGLKGVLYYLKQALEIYYGENGVYPPSFDFKGLVPGIIPEIPNDPYTWMHDKVVLTDEYIDWYYKNDTGTNTITLYAYSHPGMYHPSLQLVWTY
ncbi:MAG: hypothetical protein ACI9BD_001282 [Candidatus Marinamargulisbacteria bacterium]|jgi:hypothetical protein